MKEIIFNYQPLFGSWYVDELIGRGNYGSVYKIIRNEWGCKQVSAVKVISVAPDEKDKGILYYENLNENSITEYYEHIVKDILREIQILYKMKGNTNIVSYEDHMILKGEDKNQWHVFVRMEYLEPLSRYLMNNPLSIEDVINFGIDICKALEICKKESIIHRDIKEVNVFLSGNGSYKLGDFGVSKELKKKAIASMKGTPYYMAPEVFQGKKYDESVDIYSLGLVLYKLLNYGRMPFLPLYPKSFSSLDRDNSFEKRIMGYPLEAPHFARDILKDIIFKACSYKPKNRYKTAFGMRKDLERCLENLSLEEKNKIVNNIGIVKK